MSQKCQKRPKVSAVRMSETHVRQCFGAGRSAPLNPRSRTFIPSSVDDNPFLAQTGYKATLQALPEPLRSQMLRGDFLAGGADDPWQVIPTQWVRAAQDRWRQNRRPDGHPDALGCDPAAGGRDDTVIARRRGDWVDELVVQPGGSTPDGAMVAALVVTHLKGGAPAYIDVIGMGLRGLRSFEGEQRQRGRGRQPTRQRSARQIGTVGLREQTGRTLVAHARGARARWQRQICLPPDPRLLADLTAPRWKLTPRGIQVELKEETRKRLGRSPDRADAVILAMEGRGRDPRLQRLEDEKKRQADRTFCRRFNAGTGSTMR
jgi:hypothetical protein